MYYKLVDSCIRFQTMGIEMLGNPRTQLLIGLDEEGAQLAISYCREVTLRQHVYLILNKH